VLFLAHPAPCSCTCDFAGHAKNFVICRVFAPPSPENTVMVLRQHVWPLRPSRCFSKPLTCFVITNFLNSHILFFQNSLLSASPFFGTPSVFYSSNMCDMLASHCNTLSRSNIPDLVCVCERERERERERGRVCVRVCVNVCVRVYVCVCV